MSNEEQERLVSLAARLTEVLVGWKDTKRPDALAACLFLVGTEAGYEDAHARAHFIEFAAALLEWAFDLGAAARAAGATREASSS
jgi:hypothetical protein